MAAADTKKKKPERKCTGCNKMKAKSELLRVVREKDGGIFIDETGKRAGRGAYVCCGGLDCLNMIKKARKLEKAFSCRVPDEIYNALERIITEKTAPAVEK